MLLHLGHKHIFQVDVNRTLATATFSKSMSSKPQQQQHVYNPEVMWRYYNKLNWISAFMKRTERQPQQHFQTCRPPGSYLALV